VAFGVGYLLCQINSCGVFGTFAKEVPIMDLKLLRVAKGVEHADLVVINGKIVNVYSGEIYEGGVAVSGDKIAAIGDVAYCIGPETEIVDAKGNYLTPGFIEGHMHPESTSMAIRNFAACILKRGTTSVMTDLHEVGVVSGLEGIEAILEEARTTHVKF
jgi:adenine deaminase